MLTAEECLAKANEMEAYGFTCITKIQRDGYADVARGWRRTAMLARQQENWLAASPIGGR